MWFQAIKMRLIEKSRRVRGWLLIPWFWLTYKIRMYRLGIDERFISEAFAALAELEVNEFMKVELFNFEFLGWGNTVHIRQERSNYQFIMSQNAERQIYIQEWREATRKVMLEYGAQHETHWWEVYRSGRWIHSTSFVPFLEILYGGPKCSGLKPKEANSSPLIPKTK